LGNGTDRERTGPQPLSRAHVSCQHKLQATPIDRRSCFAAALSEVIKLAGQGVPRRGQKRTNAGATRLTSPFFGASSCSLSGSQSAFVMRLFRVFFYLFLGQWIKNNIIAASSDSLASRRRPPAHPQQRTQLCYCNLLDINSFGNVSSHSALTKRLCALFIQIEAKDPKIVTSSPFIDDTAYQYYEPSTCN